MKLALSYAGLVMVAGALLLAVVWYFLLRYVPMRAAIIPSENPSVRDLFIPGRDDLWVAFAPGRQGHWFSF